MMRALAVFLLLLTGPLSVQAQNDEPGPQGQDMYPMETPEQQERFYELLSELRCPKCQNQNIVDSDAPIAEDMRNEVYRMIQEGAGDDEVVESLVDRFGEFVRYKPSFDRRTALLWLLPAIVVFIGVIVVVVIVRRSQRDTDDPELRLSDDQRRRAENLLRRDS